jgi:hypothetical protein
LPRSLSDSGFATLVQEDSKPSVAVSVKEIAKVKAEWQEKKRQERGEVLAKEKEKKELRLPGAPKGDYDKFLLESSFGKLMISIRGFRGFPAEFQQPSGNFNRIFLQGTLNARLT